jgi:hypothetical protein
MGDLCEREEASAAAQVAGAFSLGVVWAPAFGAADASALRASIPSLVRSRPSSCKQWLQASVMVWGRRPTKGNAVHGPAS